MKKTQRLIAIALTVSCILNFVGCNKKVADELNNGAKQQELSKKGQSDIENELKIISNDDEEIVSSGYEEVDKYLQQEYENNSFQGVALIAEGDEIKFAKAYGYADENRENKVTTRFAIASNTKQFTAVAIMQLVEKGKIKLDDTIDKYFPKYKYGSSITIRDLLQMRSGIPDYLNAPEIFMKDSESIKILKDYEKEKYVDKYVEDERWTSDIILNNLYLNDLNFEPNTVYDYCNTNYYLLGLIIEQASGISYEEYVSKNIFKVAKMTNSNMKAGELDAKGHGSEESGVIVANPKFTYSAGNIYSNIYDILKWNRMLHKGDIISKESYKEMTTPVDDYGFGVFVKEGTIRHSGVIDGFKSYTEYNVANDTTLILLENASATITLIDPKYDASMINEIMKK